MDDDLELSLPLDCKSIKGHSRTIVHIDIDCFYAQVEMLRNSELRDKPLGIQQKNIVVTCNYVAREFGVQKLMSLRDAYQCCPSLVLVSGEDLTNYRAMSTKVTELLQTRFSPTVERLGFDENFVDVTQLVANKGAASDRVEGHIYSGTKESCECGCSKRLVIGSQIAADIRQSIFEEFGLTTCAGTAYNKVLAKLVGAKHKPNQQTTLFHNHVINLITDLPSIRSIPGIGRQTAEILKTKLGVQRIMDLQRCDLDQLILALGTRDVAQTVQKLGFGIDDSDVKCSGKPQSIGLEDAFKEVRTVDEAAERLGRLLQHLLDLLANQNDSRIPGTLRVTVRRYHRAQRESQRESRQCSLAALPSGDQINKCKDKLMPSVMELFHKMISSAETFHLTLLGIAFTNFSEPKKGKASILTFLEPAAKRAKLTSEESKATSQIATASAASASSSSALSDLPPSVDPEVFYQLPQNLQQEILDDWKQNNKCNRKQQSEKGKSKNSIERYFNKSK